MESNNNSPEKAHDVKKYLEKMKSIHSNVLSLIENENNVKVAELFTIYKNTSKKEELKHILDLIGTISNNHYRSSTFFSTIEQIILFFQDEIKQTFSNLEIFNFFGSNKIILLFLLENKIIQMDKDIANLIYSKKYVKSHYRLYFSPEIDQWKSESPDNEIEMKSEKLYCKRHGIKFNEEEEKVEFKINSNFENLRKKGENELPICELIRNDSIQEFIIFVNKNNYNLTQKVKPSIFESNLFLNENEVTLIEYAAFYGSIQIFQYLLMNKAKLTSTLWNCVIHSNNAEMIHKLEELRVSPLKNNYENCLIESIKCHHIDLFNYFINNYSNEMNQNAIINSCLNFCNFICLPDDFYTIQSSFIYACKYDYIQLVKLLLKYDGLYLNKSIILNCFYSNCEGILVFFLWRNFYVFYLNTLTALHCAMLNGNIDLVNYILEQPGIFIHTNCLKDCDLIKSVKINSTVKNIGNSAFENCNQLTNVSFESPCSLISIGEESFSECQGLTQITIPSSVQKIERRAFQMCQSLNQVTFEIPSSLKSILCEAFRSCNLKELVIPTSVTLIDEEAFGYCYSLQKVIFTAPSSVNRIKNGAFYRCESLISIEIPPKVTKIENNVFDQCKSLVKITIPNTVTNIGKNAFARCESLEEIVIPSSVKSIGSGIFSECTSLKKVTIPSSISVIKEETFSQCTSLTELTIPSSVMSIENNAFNGCKSLIKIKIPTNVTLIKNDAFKGCSSLAEFEIPSFVTSIGDNAFSECISLSKIKIPSSVQSIGEKSFQGCSSLKEVDFELNSSMKSLGKNCFEDCISLIYIKIDSPVNQIGFSCFRKCTSLEKVELVSSSLDTIESSAFYDCSSLKEVVISSPITKINASSFKNCKSLKMIDIPQSVLSVGLSTFENCSSLESLSFPPSVKSIGNWTFSGCTSLKEITIPSSVEMNFAMIGKQIKVNKI